MERTINVLIADSSEDYIKMLSEILEKEEDMYVVGAARDGEEAVEMVRLLKPEVLILDILLRKQDGVSVMRELRRSGDLPHVLVVSAFFNDKIASEISRLGAEYCFPKPCHINELIRRIRE